MPRLPLVLFTLASLIAFASCSDDATDTAPPDTGDGTADTESTDDGDSAGDPTVEVPTDFPIPTVGGAEIVIDSLPGIPEGVYLQLFYPADRYPEILAFYTTWVESQTVEWSPTPPDTSQGSIWFSLSLEGEESHGASVTIAPGLGSDERASVTLISQTVDD